MNTHSWPAPCSPSRRRTTLLTESPIAHCSRPYTGRNERCSSQSLTFQEGIDELEENQRDRPEPQRSHRARPRIRGRCALSANLRQVVRLQPGRRRLPGDGSHRRRSEQASGKETSPRCLSLYCVEENAFFFTTTKKGCFEPAGRSERLALRAHSCPQ